MHIFTIKVFILSKHQRSEHLKWTYVTLTNLSYLLFCWHSLLSSLLLRQH